MPAGAQERSSEEVGLPNAGSQPASNKTQACQLGSTTNLLCLSLGRTAKKLAGWLSLVSGSAVREQLGDSLCFELYSGGGKSKPDEGCMSKSKRG